jgi:DNA adenine methylase
MPQKAVINDSNTQLMLAYRAIRDDVDGLIALLQDFKERHSEAFFYEIRNQDRDPPAFDALTDTAKAARLIYLNKTCFNGLYRVNADGCFNVPVGRYKNPTICEEGLLRRINTYLNANDVTLLNADFEKALTEIPPGIDEKAFVYFDPPYHSVAKTGFTAYQANCFGENDQERLRDLMLNLAANGTPCLLSNADTDYIRKLYRHPSFNVHSMQANRRINADVSGRGSAGEVLVQIDPTQARKSCHTGLSAR